MTEAKGYRDLPLGGVIHEPGNAAEYETGDWRTMRPVWDAEKCISCLICWAYCPDSAIKVEDGKMEGINYFYCKGCGICVRECPPKVSALALVDNKDEDGGAGA